MFLETEVVLVSTGSQQCPGYKHNTNIFVDFVVCSLLLSFQPPGLFCFAFSSVFTSDFKTKQQSAEQQSAEQ